jgi:cysteinyl-tRNA synthetase
MDNDLNTSMAVTALYDVLKAKTNDRTKLALIENYDSVLCLGLLEHAATLRQKEEEQKAAEAKALADAAAADPFVAEILQLIEERKAAKKAKNFAEADRIRDYLASKGVTLIDTAQGTTYKLD